MRDGPVHSCGQRATAFSLGGAHGGRGVHLQSDSVLGTKYGDTVQDALREGRRPFPSQDHCRKGLRTHQNPKQGRPSAWKGIVYGFSKTESNFYDIWNPKPRRVVENRNVISIKTPPNLLFTARRLSPHQDLESPSRDFSDDTLDDNYVSHDDMLRDV